MLWKKVFVIAGSEFYPRNKEKNGFILGILGILPRNIPNDQSLL